MDNVRPEVTGQRIGAASTAARLPDARGPPDEYDCYTIRQFCHRNNISEASYYRLRKLSLGPTELRVGNKIVLISREAAAAWRREREAATATKDLI